MSTLKVGGFEGANRALHPLLLLETVGVNSLNQKPGRGDLRPWSAPLTVKTVTSLYPLKTIYRMGRNLAADQRQANYWLRWLQVVHCVRAPNAADTQERTYYSGAVDDPGSYRPKWTDQTLALGGEPFPTAYRLLGVPAPSSVIGLSASGGVSLITEVRAYTDTFVSSIGEESAPNPNPSEITCKVDDLVTISALAAAPSGAYGITLRRLYRTQTGLSGDTTFLKLNSVRVGGTDYVDLPSSQTSCIDTNAGTFGVLQTTTWLTPPADLSWLTGLWNGMLAGISGRSVRFCEANTFYAWPLAYEVLLASAYPVALATFGQTLVVLTDGAPSLITGGSPDSMDEQPMAFSQACVSPLSAVGLGYGVAWACPDGLAYVGQGGARILTGPDPARNAPGLMTRDDWQALKPDTIQGCMYEGRYFGFYNDGARKAFMLDPINPQGIYFLDFGVDALYLDDQVDALFVLDGLVIQQWDASSTLKTVTFRSKIFREQRPVPAFGYAEVRADAYPVTFRLDALNLDSTEVTRLMAGHPGLWSAPTATSLRYSVSVANSQPFTLPDGFHAQDWQIEVVSTNAVQGIGVAHSMQELAKV